MSSPPFAVSLVVLDVDGTLVDFVGAMRAALRAGAERIGERAGTAVTTQWLWDVRNSVAVDPAWRARSLAEIRHESFRRAYSALDVGDEAAVEELRDLYYRVRDEHMTVFPDVEDGLRALRDLGLPLIAASNGNLDLASVGLDRYFEATHYADEVGFAKPDPAFFASAVERGGGEPSTSLAIGDRLDNDYHPARAAGLHAVLLDRQGAVTEGEVLRVAALTELPSLIEPSRPAGSGAARD
jgi:putative hydrolase of the HAD superfamily